jgi:hypothetical protein
MSSIEARLARDIAAVTGSVVVTESDLKEAREVLEQNMERPQWSRRRTAAVLVAAVVVVPLVGVAVARSLGSDRSAPPLTQVSPRTQTGQTANDPELWLTGRAPTTDLVRGVWREDNGAMQVRFAEAGTFSADAAGQPFTDPDLVGDWQLSGDRITVDVTGGTAGCAGETIGMRVSLVEKGVLHVVPAKPASRCALLTETWEAMEQVLPTSPGIAGFKNSDRASWTPWPSRSGFDGLWLVEGGGFAMDLGADGSYVVAGRTGEPVDAGRWSYRSTELTLTSSARSVACDPGDRLVWTGPERVYSGTFALRATVQRNTCGGAWAGTHWIMIPDSRTR